MIETKQCRKCGEARPATSEFFEKKKGALGGRCRECVRAIDRAYRERHANDPAHRERLRAKWTRKHWRKHPEREALQIARQAAASNGERICTSCQSSLPASSEYFYPDRRVSDGLQAECKGCVRFKKRSGWLLLSPEERKAINTRRTTRQMELLGNQYHILRRSEHKRWRDKVLLDPQSGPRLKERAASQARLYRALKPEQNRGYSKAYRERNKGNLVYLVRIRASQHKSRARRLSAPGEFTGQDLKALFVRQKASCLYCGKRIGKKGFPFHVDHFIPLARGGTNFPENLALACPDCNLRKQARMPWEFMPDKFKPI